MSVKFKKPVLGRHAIRENNGVIVVGRAFADLRQPYARETVPDYLSLVDHSLALSNKQYEPALTAEETLLNQLVRDKLAAKKRSLMIVLQGRDGAGKTGARVRVEEALDYDAKLFQAICIGPPTQDELSHPHLWRFLKNERIPRWGEVRVFDRSWAERVLVEPVMKITPAAEVQRSYGELRAFEWLLQELGVIVVKVWMDITKDEQKRRFDQRALEKPWKLSTSDAIARAHWDDYTAAANEMFYRTGTDYAPWHIVSSEDKRYSRVTLLQIINAELKAKL